MDRINPMVEASVNARLESFDRLRNVTLVVPTFNRPDHLSRLLNYYASKRIPASFLILDSSQEEIAEKNRQVASTLGSNARHVIYPSSLPVAKKLLQGLELVETTFCAFCADDDLVFPEGLNKAMTFLQERPDYVCADGIYLNFFKSGNDVQLKVEYSSSGIDAEHPGARIFRLFQKYESIFYGVFRTTDLADIFANVSKIPSLHYQELFQATAALLIGKRYRSPDFYGARQHCDAAEPTRDKWQTYYWFAEDRNEFIEHYRNYRDELYAFYEKRGTEPRLSRDAFFQSMDLAHAVFFGTGCPPEYFFSVLQSQWPNDVFKKPNLASDDICDQLKGPWRRLWERGLGYVAAKALSKKSTCLPFGLNSLNRIARETCNTAWKCSLEPELLWMADVKQFREAYFELCGYLDRT